MRTPILAGIVAAFLMLAGCASAPTAPGATVPAAGSSTTASASADAENADQSVLEACDAIGTTMEDATTTLTAAMKTFGSSPRKSIAALKSFSTSMDAAVAQLVNPEVKAQGAKAVAAMKGLTEALDNLVKHPASAKQKTFTAALANLETEFTAISTVCGG